MTITMGNIGTILDGRPEGREAFLAFCPRLPKKGAEETITLDFAGVEVLTPSFADEFVTPLLELYPGKITFVNTGNITVRKTLEFLAEEWPEGAYEWRGRAENDRKSTDAY